MLAQFLQPLLAALLVAYHASSSPEDLSPGCAAGCSGHGACVAGRCACARGFVGFDCSQPITQPTQCLGDPPCSGRGACVGRTCACDAGWAGAACDRRKPTTCDCSDHGLCLNATCACEFGWRGARCDEATCLARLGCHAHGRCVDGRCACEGGWVGAACDWLPLAHGRLQ